MRTSILLGATLVCFGCGGGGGAPALTASDAVGAWSITRVTKTAGNLDADLVEGMLLRVDAQGVQVLAGSFVGPGNLLGFVVRQVYGGTFRASSRLLARGFSFSAVVDLSATIQQPAGTLYQELRVDGRREGADMRLAWLDRGFAPDALGRVVEVDRLEADVLCSPVRGDSSSVVGTYEIDRIVVIEDTGTAHDLRPGDEVVIDADGVADLFGLPLDEAAFARQAPDLRLLALASVQLPGVAQGYLLAEGRSGRALEGLTGEWFADFAGSGSGLQGLYTFTEDDGSQITDTDDLFLVLRPAGTARALAEAGRRRLWSALPCEERLLSLTNASLRSGSSGSQR